MDLEEKDRIKAACEASGCKPVVMKHDCVQKEINERIASIQSHKIASGEEILQFYTKILRGEMQDAFGLDCSIADRMKAADSLAKRVIREETDNSFIIHLTRD
jgi:hypothetical protein